ncbi:M10 family metallopeptidase C-terminal domain-containing protein [Microvirga arabica]|uniref:M10 family metallopeptidase C-terminal domain-containing protein n=1 Tax=Microvirga arabica TaxID=1128671 RepID=A0ABV6Y631_9HYPH
MFGGLGNDKLYGGLSKDTFVFNTATNKRTNVDKIYDFKSKDDSIWLDNAIFTKLGRGTDAGVKFKSKMFKEGTKATDRDDRIVYDKKSGSLYYDQDGSGSKAQVKIATLTNKTKLYYHDFFVI